MPDRADLALAHRLADRADAIARRHRLSARVAVQAKRDGSPVTDADREIERALRALVREKYPDDAFIGEESGAHGTGAATGSSTAPPVSSRGNRNGAR
jgi:histidinol-phosphatase